MSINEQVKRVLGHTEGGSKRYLETWSLKNPPHTLMLSSTCISYFDDAKLNIGYNIINYMIRLEVLNQNNWG